MQTPGGLVELLKLAFGSADEVTAKTEYYTAADGNRVGLVKRATRAFGTTLAEPTLYDYDDNRNPTSVTNELSGLLERTVETVYDDRNRLSKVTQMATVDHTAPETFYYYDHCDNRLQQVDPRGNTATWTFDAMNRPETTTLANTATATNDYDANGNVDKVTDTFGNESSYLYDERNLVTRSKLPAPFDGSPLPQHTDLDSDVYAQPITYFHYDTLGNVKSTTDPRGNETTFEYDELHRQKKATQPAAAGQHGSPITTWDYHEDGRTKEIVQPGNRTTSQTFDNFRRVVSATNPPNGSGSSLTTTTVYDLRDNARFVTTGGVETEHQYDARDRRWKTIGPDPGGIAVNLVSTTNFNDANDATSSLAAGEHVRYSIYEHDQLGRTVKTTGSDPDGADGPQASGIVEVHFDKAGNRTKTVRGGTQTTDRLFDSMNRAWYVQRPAVDGSRPTTTTTFALDGQATEVASSDRGTTNYAYDNLRRTYKVQGPTDGTNRPTSWSYYDANGNHRYSISTDTDEEGELRQTITEHDYDELNRAVVSTAPDPATGDPGTGDHVAQVFQYIHDIASNVVQSIQKGDTAAGIADRVSSFVVDSFGVVMSQVTAGVQLFSQTIDKFGRQLTVTDAEDNTTTSAYDNLGRLTSVTLPDGETESYAYNAFGQTVSSTDALGQVTHYDYGLTGAVTRTTAPHPDGPGQTVEEIVADDSATSGWTEALDVGGYDDDFHYVDGGSAVSPHQWTFADLDPDKEYQVLVSWSVDASNTADVPMTVSDGATLLDTGALDQTTLIVDATLDDRSWQSLGVFSITTGNSLVIALDASSAIDTGRVVADAVRVVETTPAVYNTYDSLGRVIASTDALGHTTSFAYDALGRKTSTTDANGDTTTFDYDLAGRMTSLTDPEGNATTFVYDTAGRLISEQVTVDSQTLTRTNSYSLTGSPLRSVDRQGRVVDTTYDMLGRAVEQRWYNNATDADADTNRQNTVTTHYDVFDRTTGLADDWSDYTYAYDTLDRLVTETIANLGAPTVVLTTGYTRDDSLRTSLSATIAGTADFQNLFVYDDRLRMTSVTQTGQTGGNAVAPKHVAFTHTDTGRFATIARYAAADDTDNLVATTAYTYDAQERLTALDHTQGVTTLSNYTWTYDAAGRLIQNTSTDGTVDYSYDARGQLTAADYDYQSDETYEYDTNGNRETANGSTYATGDHNRMTFDGTYTYQYDAEGNRTRRFVWTDTDVDGVVDVGEAATITEYTWDIQNRLTAVTERATDGGAATKTVEHTYDIHNRWIKRSVDPDGAGPLGSSDTHFAYDNNQIILQFDDPDGPGGQSPALTNRYLWSPAVDQVLADETADDGGPEDVLWPLADHLGTVRDLATFDDATDLTTIANHRVYSAYGQVTSETNSAVDHLFHFTGRPLDEETDLQNNHHRWYDAPVGEWLNDDPIGIKAGDANFGRYVGNGPVTGTDPDGLEVPASRRPYMNKAVHWDPMTGQYSTDDEFRLLRAWTDASNTRRYMLRTFVWGSVPWDGGYGARYFREEHGVAGESVHRVSFRVLEHGGVGTDAPTLGVVHVPFDAIPAGVGPAGAIAKAEEEAQWRAVVGEKFVDVYIPEQPPELTAPGSPRRRLTTAQLKVLIEKTVGETADGLHIRGGLFRDGITYTSLPEMHRKLGRTFRNQGSGNLAVLELSGHGDPFSVNLGANHYNRGLEFLDANLVPRDAGKEYRAGAAINVMVRENVAFVGQMLTSSSIRWAQQNGKRHGLIVLRNCSTGLAFDSIAQKLADETGLHVAAPGGFADFSQVTRAAIDGGKILNSSLYDRSPRTCNPTTCYNSEDDTFYLFAPRALK